MTSLPKCPFCLKTMADPSRHIDIHAESPNLTLFVFDRLYNLTEDKRGYQCPLCSTAALPFELYKHLQSHFLVETSDGDASSASSDTEDICEPQPPKKRKLMAETPVLQHDTALGFVPQPQRLPPAPSSSTSSNPHKRRNPFLNPPTNQPSGSAPSQTQRRPSVQFSCIEEPSTPTPNPHPHTPPSSLALNRHRPQLTSPPDAIKLLRTNLQATLSSQCAVVSKFLNSHKGTCMAHTLLGRSPLHPHSSLKSCDLMRYVGSPEYNRFRSSFRLYNNPSRCASCGCPKIDGVDHQGSWDGSPRLCKDEDLQEWVLGLAFYVWEVPLLHDRIFELLGIPIDSFGGGEDGRNQFAAWLAYKNGRDLSWTASNLLDLLFVVASNIHNMFGAV